MRFYNRPLIRWADQRWFGVSFDYDPAVAEELKGIPIRAWDGMTKTWWFPEQFVEHVRGVLAPRFPQQQDLLNQIIHRRPAPKEKPRWKEEDPYVALGLREDAPDEVVKAAYAAMLKALDPERNMGGSTEPQERIRMAFERIKAERGL